MVSRSKIDRGEVNRSEYIFHSLIGHHGLFSLTPMWLLSLAGMMAMLVRRVTPSLRSLGTVILLVSLGCLTFYFSLAEEARNYGGMTSGPRWFFWLIPALVSRVDSSGRLVGGESAAQGCDPVAAFFQCPIGELSHLESVDAAVVIRRSFTL